MHHGHRAADAPGASSRTIDGVRHDLTSLTTEQIVDLGIALVPEGRRLFPEAHGRGEPRARRVPADRARADQAEPRSLLRDLPAARRAAKAARRLDVGRRAADAGARPRADAGAEDPAGRRAVGRPRADPGQPHHRQDQGAEGAAQPHRADGRAELQPGDPHRRPRLCHRARQDRVRTAPPPTSSTTTT